MSVTVYVNGWWCLHIPLVLLSLWVVVFGGAEWLLCVG